MAPGGDYTPGRWLSIRILAGTWCLSCFVLITAYSSVLTSFIVSPNIKPIIDSVYDIPKVFGLQVLIDKDSTMYKAYTMVHLIKLGVGIMTY